MRKLGQNLTFGSSYHNTKNEFFRNIYKSEHILYVVGCLEGESKRYRVFNFIEGLSSIGVRGLAITEIEISDYLKIRPKPVAIVLFRCAYSSFYQRLISYANSNNIQTFFDVDDLIFEPENTDFVRVLNTMSDDERRVYNDGVKRYRKMLELCDYAIVTTSFLAQRVQALGKRVFVLANTVNNAQILVSNEVNSDPKKSKNDKIVISYFSGSNTHDIDFLDCEAALLRIMEEYKNVQFLIGGILNLTKHKWAKYWDRIQILPIMPYLDYLRSCALADINIAPLERGNPYCEAKSPLKIFEAGLVKVPTIASDISGYREAIDNGQDGFLVHNTDEWYSAFKELVCKDSLRNKVGELAYQRSRRQFFINNVIPKAYDVLFCRWNKKFERVQKPTRFTDKGLPALRILWMVPEPIIGGGGHNHILRSAYYLDKFGHDIRIYFVGTYKSDEELANIVNTHFYPIKRNKIFRYEGAVEPCDIGFATHWSTVKLLLYNKRFIKKLMYYVQDYEPLFYAMGSEYIMAENTYRLGLYHITAGPWCAETIKRNYNGKAVHYRFPIDRKIYYPRRTLEDREQEVIFFAKPEMLRRCYEIGIEGLEIFHRLCPNIVISLYGSNNVSPRYLPFPTNFYGILPTINDLANLYSRAMVGVAFSSTNPSLVPFEMMASGLPVVDLQLGDSVSHYDSLDNITLADPPTPETVAFCIKRLVEDKNKRISQAQKALAFIDTLPTEMEMARLIESYIVDCFMKNE